MKRTGILALALILGTVAPNLVFAQTSDVNKNGSRAMDMKGMDTKSTDMKGKEMNKGAPTTGHTGHGVVRSVNTVDGIVTLAHEPIKTLGWPAMTMAFKVQNRQLLDRIKPGNSVEFTLVPAGKDYVVTSLR
jgi:Cu(I)/Ag(I) efflux system periplasmic protein CusF